MADIDDITPAPAPPVGKKGRRAAAVTDLAAVRRRKERAEAAQKPHNRRRRELTNAAAAQQELAWRLIGLCQSLTGESHEVDVGNIDLTVIARGGIRDLSGRFPVKTGRFLGAYDLRDQADWAISLLCRWHAALQIVIAETKDSDPPKGAA